MKLSSNTRILTLDLFKMTWPMLFGVLSLMSFQLVDSAFIAQLGVLPLAAQGFTLPMQMVVIGLQVGLGIATTALISRVLGANEEVRAQQLGGLVVLVGGIGIALLCGVIWLLRDVIMHLLDAPEKVLPIIDTYWPVWLMSAWCGSMLYFAYSLCRANGNTLLPGTMMMVTSLLNIVLDPLFIFKFGLGINGAAWATITAFIIGMLVVFPLVMKKKWLSFHWVGLNIIQSIKELGHIMAPAMMSQLLPPVSSMLATKLVAGFGAATVGAWALGSRIEFFSIVVVLALTMSMPQMVGKRLGKRDIQGIKTLINIAVCFVLAWQFIIAMIIFLLSSPLSSLLSSDVKVQQVLLMHLTRVPISLGALGVCMIMVSICNALAMPMRALFISAWRLFICFLPILWIGSQLAGLPGLFTGAMLGNIAAGISAWIFYRKGLALIDKKYQFETDAVR
ncbi:Fis family transcriptional regulator [Photobacterium angustum]|uniref:MATE family efflux transporter n=1 Tax=Photobacterium angustum TaxID=661 RepID=UPI0005E2F190|nr:MATE family efflux transporter [Photobacterium angustum]KJF93807.1 Fis family transcriptional regulator [Photobacterium angustum]KJG08107.1 Fis family transcriptional regulator [Photobacterium angustum]PSV89754.1 MATE family efflux transporter [Photobacterium angustum]PSW82224.1 MATE family efflux transporter [Photobacterium angustum]